MGFVFKQDGGVKHEPTKHNSEFERKMDKETTEMLWSVINENTQLSQENYMLKNKLEQITRLLNDEIQ